ncbi:MAG: ABC transporter ATP-binding protein [Rhodospirillaceae bacterium]|nr:ABC transporter ATP-binding protein [Rhodospirillaceae bacterium]
MTETTALLEARQLGIAFGGLRAVDEVSFAVRPGEVFTIVGPNGAGKTTVFNLISRIYDPTDGRIFFAGADITAVPPHRIARLGIARTFQNIELFEHASVLQNLLVGRHCRNSTSLLGEIFFTPAVMREELHHRERVERIIDFLDLQHYREQIIANLPYGVRKVVELGRALSTEPRLLLLDEPASGLNIEETDDLANWIDDIRSELKITVLMIEHDMRLVSRVSDRVLAMNQGRVLAEGGPAEVQRHPDVVRAYLGA